MGDGKPGQPAAVARALVHGQQNGFGLVAEQFRVCQRAGCDNTHHFALDGAFAGDFAHLLTNRHRLAQFDQTREVSFYRVKRHTRHHHRLPGRLAALREGDVEKARGFFGVGKKQLVKVTHAVQQQGVRVPGLERQVLLHHGGVVGKGFGWFLVRGWFEAHRRIMKGTRFGGRADEAPMARKSADSHHRNQMVISGLNGNN